MLRLALSLAVIAVTAFGAQAPKDLFQVMAEIANFSDTFVKQDFPDDTKLRIRTRLAEELAQDKEAAKAFRIQEGFKEITIHKIFKGMGRFQGQQKPSPFQLIVSVSSESPKQSNWSFVIGESMHTFTIDLKDTSFTSPFQSGFLLKQGPHEKDEIFADKGEDPFPISYTRTLFWDESRSAFYLYEERLLRAADSNHGEDRSSAYFLSLDKTKRIPESFHLQDKQDPNRVLDYKGTFVNP